MRSPVDLNKFSPFSLNSDRLSPIEISRGCPHTCRFCQTSFLFGTRMRHRDIDRILKYIRISKESGIKDFRFHDLRHTAASHLHMAGVDIKDIKEIGGWKTLHMVDRYTHISTKHKRTSMLLLESEIRPQIETSSEKERVTIL